MAIDNTRHTCQWVLPNYSLAAPGRVAKGLFNSFLYGIPNHVPEFKVHRWEHEKSLEVVLQSGGINFLGQRFKMAKEARGYAIASYAPLPDQYYSHSCLKGTVQICWLALLMNEVIRI